MEQKDTTENGTLSFCDSCAPKLDFKWVHRCASMTPLIIKPFLKQGLNTMVKNQTHVKVRHTSEFLFGIYWWTWKTTIKKTVEVCQ